MKHKKWIVGFWAVFICMVIIGSQMLFVLGWGHNPDLLLFIVPCFLIVSMLCTVLAIGAAVTHPDWSSSKKTGKGAGTVTSSRNQ